MPPSAPEPVPARLRWVLLLGGAIGLVASFTLTLEKLALLEDPANVPSCSINPILSCGSIMRSAQAELFGFPNPLLGVVGFSVVATVALALFSGATFSRWFWLGLQGGATAGLVLVHWLIVQSLYRIGALCPYCMAVWAATIPIFWYVTLYNARRAPLAGTSLVRRLDEYHGVALTCWYLLIVALVGQRFWSYWSGLIY